MLKLLSVQSLNTCTVVGAILLAHALTSTSEMLSLLALAQSQNLKIMFALCTPINAQVCPCTCVSYFISLHMYIYVHVCVYFTGAMCVVYCTLYDMTTFCLQTVMKALTSPILLIEAATIIGTALLIWETLVEKQQKPKYRTQF